MTDIPCDSLLPLIPDIWFTIILTVLLAITTFLTARGPLDDKRFKKRWWKQINTRGYWVIGINTIIILILILQFFNTEYRNCIKDEELKKEQLSRDSLISIGIQDGVNNGMGIFFEKLSLAFKNQGLKIDTLNGIIEKLEINESTTNNYVSELKPVLQPAFKHEPFRERTTDGGKTYSYSFRYESSYAPSKNVYLTIKSLVETVNDEIYVGTNTSSTGEMAIPKEAWVTYGVASGIEKAKKVYVYLKGSYTNLSASETYFVDQMYLKDYQNSPYDSLGVTTFEAVVEKHKEKINFKIDSVVRAKRISQ